MLDDNLSARIVSSETKFSLVEYFTKLLFYKGLVISFTMDGFRNEDIGTIFWNNGTHSLIKSQNFLNQSEVQMNWLETENHILSGIVYMP